MPRDEYASLEVTEPGEQLQVNSRSLSRPDDAEPSGTLTEHVSKTRRYYCLRALLQSMREEDGLEDLNAAVADLSIWSVYMDQGFHIECIAQLKRTQDIFSDCRRMMMQSLPCTKLRLLCDLDQILTSRAGRTVRQSTIGGKQVSRFSFSSMLMRLFAKEVKLHSELPTAEMLKEMLETLLRLTSLKFGSKPIELWKWGHALLYPEDNWYPEHLNMFEAEKRGCQAFISKWLHEHLPANTVYLEFFKAAFTKAVSRGRFGFLDRKSVWGALDLADRRFGDHSNNTLGCMIVGFILETLINQGVMEPEDCGASGMLESRIRDLATVVVPRFTETMHDLMAILENQVRLVREYQEKAIACSVSVFLAGSQVLFELYLSWQEQGPQQQMLAGQALQTRRRSVARALLNMTRNLVGA